jgi:hypothetical protein
MIRRVINMQTEGGEEIDLKKCIDSGPHYKRDGYE